MVRVNSSVLINRMVLKRLTRAQVTALEKTAEALHTEVVQAQVMPRDTGTMQNEGTFVDYSKSAQGTVSLVTSTPYARRLYYHPEYHFQKTENPNAKGRWYEDWVPGGKEESFAVDTYKDFYRSEAGL